MTSVLMTVDYLRHTQATAIAETTRKLNGLATNLPTVLNALFQSAQRFNPGSASVEMNWWVRHVLTGVPYSTTELFDAIFRASYFEATMLCRHLLEVAVQLRFYEQQPARFLTDSEWQRRRIGMMNEAIRPTRPDFKSMFEAVAPGQYERLYSSWLSSAAHGGIAASVFRFARTESDTLSHDPGAHFNENHAGILLTHLCPLVHGLLRAYLRLDAGLEDRLAPAAAETVAHALTFLQQCSGQDWVQFPEKRPILDSFSTIADWPAPPNLLAPK